MNKIFQVEKHLVITENTFSVAGRMIAGDIIHKGEVFNLIKIDNNTLVEVNFTLKQIEMYGRSIDFIDLGCTGVLFLEGECPTTQIKELIITAQII
ncbi:hypothetical protein [Capnocytophaga granulosa]|uniref:hypothetical protein n=1 Tax=Capnocytophaga granulosa TaxID=45242 RepID=UPI0028EB55E4|nr:hypothetical protein [Capnocytophaga granulosa]